MWPRENAYGPIRNGVHTFAVPKDQKGGQHLGLHGPAEKVEEQHHPLSFDRGKPGWQCEGEAGEL